MLRPEFFWLVFEGTNFFLIFAKGGPKLFRCSQKGPNFFDTGQGGDQKKIEGWPSYAGGPPPSKNDSSLNHGEGRSREVNIGGMKWEVKVPMCI